MSNFTTRIEIQKEGDKSVPFIHLGITKWTAETKRDLLEHLTDIEHQLAQDGYTYMGAYNVHEDEKWHKFMSILGYSFSFVGKGMTVYIRIFGDKYGH